jgi:hypothetical protein
MKLELRKLGQRWMGTNQASQTTLDEQTLKGLLAEYNSLKSEIHQTQGRRMQILSLSVGAFGVILSFTGIEVLGDANIEPEGRLWIAIGTAVALYAIAIPSLTMMIGAQKHVRRLGWYIGTFIEPLVPGLNWERHLLVSRSRWQHRWGIRSMSMTYFFLSILPLLLPMYALNQYRQGWPVALIILVPLFCWSIYLSYDLRIGKSKGDVEWWEDYASKHAPGTHPPPALEHAQTPGRETAPEKRNQP